MAQQFYQPQRRRRDEEQSDDSGGIYPSFYTGSEGSSSGANKTVSDIDDVLAQNDALMSGGAVPSGADLMAAEQAATSGIPEGKGESGERGMVAGLYRPDKDGKNSKGRQFIIRRRDKLIMGGGLGGLLLGIILSAFFAIPLKIQHIADNLQDQFYSSAEEAVEDMTDNLMRTYVVKYLAPGMVQNNCTSTAINRKCANTSNSSTIVGVLFNSWRDARLENKLANRGIEIRKVGAKFYLHTPSTGPEGRSMGTYTPDNPDAFRESAFRELNRNEIRQEIRAAFRDETFWKRSMYRFRVGGLLERKYGIQRCIIACQTRDKFTDNIEARKSAFKALFYQRVVGPQSEFMSLALQCASVGFACTELGEADENNERTSQLERDFRASLAEFRLKYPDADIEALHNEAENIRKVGLVDFIVKKLLGEAVAKASAKAIPIVGWLDMGAQLFAGAEKIGPAVTKMAYVAAAYAAVDSYMMLRTNADEIKTGNVDLMAAGSVATALSPTDGVDRMDQNGVGAEASPAWTAFMGSEGSKGRTVATSSIVYAAASKQYGCEDNGNKAPPKGKVICDVERLDNKTSVGSALDKLSDIANSPVFAVGSFSAEVWNSTGGWLLRQAEGAIGGIISAAIKLMPGNIEEKIAEIAEPLIKTMMTYVIKPSITASMSGARLFNIMVAGADVSGNDFAHYSLGAAPISFAQAHEIRAQREQERQDEFNGRSTFARIFSTDTKYSLVSKAAIATPLTSNGNISGTLASTLSNPFGALGSSFSGLLASPSVSAAVDVDVSADPWGVTQYGYSPDEPVFKVDPEQFYEDNDCDNPERNKAWGNRAAANPNTEMPDHKPGDTNPCLLVNSAAASSGAIFTDEVLSDEERAALTGDTAPGGDGLGGDFRIATFNVRGASHTDEASDHRANKDWRDRMNVTIKTIQDSDLEVIGFQEFQGKQRDLFKEKMGANWELTKEGDHHYTENPIGWDTTKFSKVGTEKAMPGLLYFNNSKLGVPYVKLKHNLSGQEFYVLNTHDPANANCDCASERLNNANQHVEFINSLKSEGLPIFFVGDFNSGYEKGQVGKNGSTVGNTDDNVTYCILTRNGTMEDAYDLSKKRGVKCPNPIDNEDRGGAANGIDHIYVTNGVTVSKFARLAGGYTKNGSDHPTAYADVSMPGSDDGGSAPGSVKMKDDYKAECSKYPDVACSGQCVDFVKFRLKKHIDRNKFADFTTGTGGVAAYTSSDNLGKQYGYKVDNNPAVNSVVSWPAGGVAGSGANDIYGHVAMVSKVNVAPDGSVRSIVVEEYNATSPALSYGTRTLSGSVAKLLKYAHTEVDFK